MHNTDTIHINVIKPLIGITLMALVIYLLLPGGNFSELTRLYAPPGQTLYVFSKVTALFVYILMWWQILLGLLNKVKTRNHMLLGISVIVLILTHVFLFVSAVSIRQNELNINMLLPDFTNGYYKIGLSLGVIALIFILAASISSMLRQRLKRFWKLGHALVYLTFVLATAHGLMIGSEVNSGLFSYVVYGATLSLSVTLIYKKRSLLVK